MMTKHKMNLFCGMLLLSASLFVEKAQAMFPERYVSEESAARAGDEAQVGDLRLVEAILGDNDRHNYSSLMFLLSVDKIRR